MKDIDKKVLEYGIEIIEGIRRLVKIPSIEGNREKHMSFGKYPRLSLGEALKLSEGLGFIKGYGKGTHLYFPIHNQF